MDKNKIIIVILVAVIAVFAFLLAYPAFLSQPQPADNVIDVGALTFNTTNATNFTADINESGELRFHDANGTGKYTVFVYDYDDIDYPAARQKYLHEHIENAPVRDINGVAVYTSSATQGDSAGEPRYMAYIVNNDKNIEFFVSTPDANETAKIILSARFK